jgi:hypothetical protein
MPATGTTQAVHVMVTHDSVGLTTVSAIATVVAAVAALVTIYFARKTVHESTEARRDSHNARVEEMAETTAATKAAAARHRAEMDERKRTFEADIVLRRLAQLEQVSELLLHLVEVARIEYFQPPEPLRLEGAQVVTTTRVPAIQARLRTAVAILKKLGGPDFTAKLPASSSGDEASSMRVWTEGINLWLRSNCSSPATPR